MPTARSTPNIALIKYWGNRSNDLRLPAADSLSMTLDRPTVEITVEASDAFTMRSFEADGSEKALTEKHTGRFRQTISLMRLSLKQWGMEKALPRELSITVRSHIPPAVGLASSAAVFSCLARALAGLMEDAPPLTDEQVSVLARLGSGSAARSIFGGYAALRAGTGEAIDSAVGEQIADERHWILYDTVVIPSIEEKKVGSTEGHALAHTSPCFKARIDAITSRREQECIDAILTRDFEKLRRVAEEDCLDMHHVMQTSTPPLHYLTEDTHRIVNVIRDLRTKEHLPVLFTMDAGPTVHLICPEEARNAVVSFAKAQNGCTIFETKIGSGVCLPK